jgi:hypothetical protein
MSSAFPNGGHGGLSVADFLRRLASFNVVLLLSFEWRPRKSAFSVVPYDHWGGQFPCGQEPGGALR